MTRGRGRPALLPGTTSRRRDAGVAASFAGVAASFAGAAAASAGVAP
jgi:hypothetical protein